MGRNLDDGDKLILLVFILPFLVGLYFLDSTGKLAKLLGYPPEDTGSILQSDQERAEHHFDKGGVLSCEKLNGIQEENVSTSAGWYRSNLGFLKNEKYDFHFDPFLCKRLHDK